MNFAPWLIWVSVAVLALAGEVFTLGLYLGCVGVSALITAALSFALPAWAQVLIFLALSILLLGVARPAVLRVLPYGGDSPTSPRLGPAGRSAVVVQRLSRQGGQVRIGEGEFWSARTVDPDVVLLPGREVEIVKMEGLTALVRPVPEGDAESVEKDEAYFGLSPREVEVLRLMGRGLSNQEIADQLFLSPRTVHHHVSHILTKMDASSRLEAVTLALQRGLMKPGD